MFKKIKRFLQSEQPKQTDKPESDTRQTPMCEDSDAHYYWTDGGWPCPLCNAEETFQQLEMMLLMAEAERSTIH